MLQNIGWVLFPLHLKYPRLPMAEQIVDLCIVTTIDYFACVPVNWLSSLQNTSRHDCFARQSFDSF